MARTRLCEICKRVIEDDRAEILPDTRLCAEHGQEIAAYGGEFTLTATQERTSKAGSMKLNYGSVATKKERNHQAIARLRDAYEAKKGS